MRSGGRGHQALSVGQIVDVVAPGFAVTPSELDGAIAYLKSWGLIPRVHGAVVSGGHFLHSHDDKGRFLALKKALTSQDSHLIWCLRGGYGSNRLISHMDRMRCPTKSKILIGMSDVTSLHLYLNQFWKWSSLHGPVLDRLGKGLVSKGIQVELKKILFGEKTQVEFEKLVPLNELAKRLLFAKGRILGGNLTVLQGSIGTPYALNLRGCFLFVEDLGERGYRVDRILEHMHESGILRGCRGILVGDFTGGEEPSTGRSLVGKVWRRFAVEKKIPIWTGLPVGHGKNQWALPLGTLAEICKTSRYHNLKIDTGIRKETS